MCLKHEALQVLSGMVEDAAVWCIINGLVVGDCDNPVRHSVPSVSWSPAGNLCLVTVIDYGVLCGLGAW
jgi:hypothetical protein